MSHPFHDSSCTSLAFEMPCPACKEPVFYYKCSCGSKIFFNEPGYPWEIHNCDEYRITKELELMLDIDRLSKDEIYEEIVKHEKRFDTPMGDKLLEIIENFLGRRNSKLIIQAQFPEEKRVEVSGKIIEFNRDINILKKLGYDATSERSEQLLGKYAKQIWGSARIRTNPNKLNICQEYLVYIQKAYYKDYQIKNTSTVTGIVYPRTHGLGTFWELEVIKII